MGCEITIKINDLPNGMIVHYDPGEKGREIARMILASPHLLLACMMARDWMDDGETWNVLRDAIAIAVDDGKAVFQKLNDDSRNVAGIVSALGLADEFGAYEGEICTCTKDCPSACKGSCGCKACAMGYGDYLSSQGD